MAMVSRCGLTSAGYGEIITSLGPFASRVQHATLLLVILVIAFLGVTGLGKG